ncbi:hypothetical protein KAR48_06080 [bacterium]|nr:hypothetical protein [bacterium]
MKKFSSLFLTIIIFGLIVSLASAQTEPPKMQLPVLTTSAGQSADINTLNVVLEQAGVMYDYCDVPTVDMVKAGVGLGGQESGSGFHVEILTELDKYPKGTAFKSIILAIGASLKGMGASGLTIEDELKRVSSLIKYCTENKILIIAVHAGGESKRGADGSNNERMIDAVAPYADYIIAVKDSNKDGRFSKIAEEKKIPYSEATYALDIVTLIEQIYN